MQSCIQSTQYHNFYTNATLYRFVSQREGQMAATGDQIRMARALLKLSIRDLSEITEIDKNTVSRIRRRRWRFRRNASSLAQCMREPRRPFP